MVKQDELVGILGEPVGQILCEVSGDRVEDQLRAGGEQGDRVVWFVASDDLGAGVGEHDVVKVEDTPNGTIRKELLPGDVVMAMSCLWRTPDTAEGHAQARRLLDIILRGLEPTGA